MGLYAPNTRQRNPNKLDEQTLSSSGIPDTSGDQILGKDKS